MGFVPLDPLDIAISGHGPAIEGIQGRLAANVLGARRLGRASLAPLVDVNVDIDVPVNHRSTTVGGKSLVGNLGWCWLMEQFGGGSPRGAVVAIVLVEALSFHDSGATTSAVFVNVNVAVASREAFVLLEAKVLLFIGAATNTTTATAGGVSSHALELLAVPSFSGARRVVEAIQVARR